MAKQERTDPMGPTHPLPRTTQPMVAPPAPASSEDLTATSEARTAASPDGSAEKEEAGAPGKPALSKAEIRSIFRELSDGLGEPSSHAAAPESEVAQYAAPRPLPAKNKTPALEPAIVLRKSVLDEVLPLQAMPGPRAKERRARVGTDTVRAQRLVTRTRARIGVAVTVVALALAATVVLQKREPEKVSDSKRTLAPDPSGAKTLPAASAAVTGSSTPSAPTTNATAAESQPTAVMTDASPPAPKSPNAASLPASPKIVQAKPSAAPHPSAVTSARPREKRPDDDIPEL
jgi:hypothetical protein